MKFRQCPRCGNCEKGFTIAKCKKCNGFYCWKDGGIFSSDEGCGTGSDCPNCGGSKDVGFFSDSFDFVGEIE